MVKNATGNRSANEWHTTLVAFFPSSFLIVRLAEDVSSVWAVTPLRVSEFSFCCLSAFEIPLAKKMR